MYEIFISHNSAEFSHQVKNEFLTESINIDLKKLFDECAGGNFRNGLYKIHTPDSSLHWAILISKYFPKYIGKIMPFGYDWMGRQFALDTSREKYLFMFDPATAEYFELEMDIASFHNNDLVYERDTTLSEDLFSNVLQSLSLEGINYNSCIGHKLPLFLGGKDVIENYEVWDIEVYWEMLCQIYIQIKDLPEGTPVDKIIFNPIKKK